MNPIPYLVGWEPAAGFIVEEARQLAEEGRDPQWIERVLGGLDWKNADAVTLSALWTRLQEAPVRTDFAFVEPNDLDGIHAERETATRRRPLPYDDAELGNRMRGAWLGRCCGCALGKPLELFMSPHEGLSSRERIRAYLLGIGADEYPLRDYVPGASPAQGKTGETGCPDSQREKIAFMETDDDIRYTVIGQKILLEKGGDFTTRDVMAAWLGMLPYGWVCTAETQAYRNYVLRYRTHMKPEPEADWLWVATHQNPYREWIGAQIRADSWGYAAPGDPERAADYAWRDARMSHVKNGIYGEMFVAAMIAAAFASTDPFEVIAAGLAEIPRRSRLHRDIRLTVDLCRKHDCRAAAFEEVFDGIEAALGAYSPVHTNNNAALVAAALLLGKDDFEKTITLAVTGGWDTDCNGATAGSIFGAMHGAGAIPEKWAAPLHDTLYSAIPDYHPIAISECAKRSFEIAKKLAA